MRNAIAVCLATLAAATASAQSAPDVRTIIARSVAANQTAWKVAPEYSFEERDREKGGTKTYDVTMILGSPYSRLIKINDEPLSAADNAREAQKLQEETVRRRSESDAQRQKRIAAYQQERERDHVLLEQVSEAFDFSLVGREQLASRPVYHLHATPRPGYSPPNLHARALTGMTGDLWIDVATFNWVKVTALVKRSVAIAGFVARVEPGTFFELEYMPLRDGVWLPRHFAMRARSEILGVIRHGSQDEATYSNYRRTAPSTH